jgi:hypothetical protein
MTTADDLVAIREGLAQAKRSEGQDAAEAFKALRAMHGLDEQPQPDNCRSQPTAHDSLDTAI